MATMLQTNAFRFNKDETIPGLRFPDLALRAYSFNLQLNGVSYIVRISYNIWTNNGQLSIYTPAQVALILNVPLIADPGNNYPNYVSSIIDFNGYSLTWNIESQQFVFSKD